VAAAAAASRLRPDGQAARLHRPGPGQDPAWGAGAPLAWPCGHGRRSETPCWGRGTEAAEPGRGDRREVAPPQKCLGAAELAAGALAGPPPAAAKACALHSAHCSSSPAPAPAAGARRTPRQQYRACSTSLLFSARFLHCKYQSMEGGAGCSPTRGEATRPHSGKLMVPLQPAGSSTAPNPPGAALIKTAIGIRPYLLCARCAPPTPHASQHQARWFPPSGCPQRCAEEHPCNAQPSSCIS